MRNNRTYGRSRTATSAAIAGMSVFVFGGYDSAPARAQDPMVPLSAEADSARINDNTVELVDIRVAPTFLASEMLYGAAWGISDHDIPWGDRPVTLYAAGRLLEEVYPLFSAATQPPRFLELQDLPALARPWQVDAGDATMRSNTTFANLCQPSIVPLPEVPRRVAGVLLMRDGRKYAILEIGAPFASNHKVQLVSYIQGNGSQVASGTPGSPELMVAGIDATGITLADANGGTICVPLASRER